MESISPSSVSVGAEPLLKFEAITKSFAAVRALRGVDFELRPGEVHGLLGQNGAGKSTLIKILSGVYSKDGGRMEVGGKDVHFRSPSDSRDAGIAVVYQELSLIPGMTVAANLHLGREENRMGFLARRKIERDAREFLEEHGLPLDPQAVVQDLPFAYRQLTEIAKALTERGSILVLDEPTSALSGGEEQILFDAVEQVTKRGVGVIYVTHRMGEVFALCQRVTVLRDGANVGTWKTSETDMASLVSAIVGSDQRELSEAIDAAVEGDEAEVVASVPKRRAVATPGQAPMLELRGVSNDRLRGVDLAIQRGEIFGLAGMVGSGRTEILETVFGLRRVQEGQIVLDGEPVRFRHPTDAIRRGVALAPEDRHEEGLVLEHSIERNMALPFLPLLARYGWFRRQQSKTRALDAMSALSVKAPGPNTPVKLLSGGNQQKVVFGRWAAPPPKVLLLDEPTVGVDVGAREDIYGVVRALAERDCAIVVVSSELVELLLICDRIGVVHDGRVVQIVDRADLRNEEELHHLVQESQQ